LCGDDIELGVHKGPGLQLAPNTATIKGVLDHLDSTFDDLLNAGRMAGRERVASRVDGPQLLLNQDNEGDRSKPATSSDSNKIRFCFKRSAFKIIYTDDTGKTHRQTKSFEVPRVDLNGILFLKDEYTKVKASFFKKAKEAWNKLDKSCAPRYPVDASGRAV
jgi:hypothetical protein